MNALEELREMERLQDSPKLSDIADRIENEYMELPKVDGKPVHIGERIETPDGDVLGVDGFVRSTDGFKKSMVWIRFSGGRQAEPGRCSQPDSWEKIETDAKNDQCAYYGCMTRDCTEKGGCPVRSKFPRCHIEMRLDLIRRCKRLAGVNDGRVHG